MRGPTAAPGSRPATTRPALRGALTALAAALSFWAQACAAGGGAGPVPIPELTFAPGLGVEVAAMTVTSSGLYLQDLVVGEGEEVRSGSLVTVHYMGWFPDGRLFEASPTSGGPVSFRVGRREVIPGWDEGIRGMRAGGRRRLVIPPRLAYGRQGREGGIPPDATLVFEIQLLEVR